MTYWKNKGDSKNGGDRRRSLWKWIGVYLIIAIIVYGAAYAYIRYSHPKSTPRPQEQSQPSRQPAGNSDSTGNPGSTQNPDTGDSDGGFFSY